LDAILVLELSLDLTTNRLSLLFVKGRIESNTVFSNPFNVKFARVGDIIPPCGVPLSVFINTPLSIAPLVSQLSIILRYLFEIYTFSNNQA